MTDLALWRLDSRILPVVLCLVHCRGGACSSGESMNNLLNSGWLLSLRIIVAIFLSGRRINARDFKCRRDQLLPAPSYRALIPLML